MSVGSQRQHVVLLFTDLTGSTQLGAAMEPELYADLLQQLRGLIDGIMSRHGGEIARIDGDGALCIFGYPVAHEDAGRRAVEAALDLHAAAAGLDERLGDGGARVRMHSGIHAGVVLLRTGDMVRGRYEMLGNATNIAARLCDAAGENVILVSEETLASDRHLFHTGPNRQMGLQGCDTSIGVLSVLGRRESPTRLSARERAGLTPFVGRCAELAALHAWLDRPAQAQADLATVPVMLLHGPAGIGKSRLCAELSAAVAGRGLRVLRGYCEAYPVAQPLQPFVQIATALGMAAPPRSKEKAIDAILPLIALAASETGLLILIDDWQWSDDGSRELLQAIVAAGSARGNVRVLLASRRSDPDIDLPGPFETLPLLPLDGGPMALAIAHLLPASDPFARARIEEASGGSPLLIEELCHSWSAGGTAVPSHRSRGAWFDLLVSKRFSQLPEQDAALLRLAAVIGNMVPLWLLAAAHCDAIDPATLDRLKTADFLFPADGAGMIRFKHGLTRDAVYAVIGLDERRALHARVLTVLESHATRGDNRLWLDALARHSAGAGARETATTFAIQAGDAALSVGAPDRAQAHYRAAFGLVRRLPPGPESRDVSWALLNKLGLACIVDPSADQLPILDEVRRLLVACGDIEGEIRGYYWMGAIAYGIGQGRRSVELFRTALALAVEHDRPRFVDQIRTKLAQSLFAAGDYGEAERMFRQLMPAFRAGGGRNDRDTALYALSCHAFLLADQGRFDEADQLQQVSNAVEDAPASPLIASCQTQRAAVALWRGEWREARSLAEQCFQTSRKAGTRFQAMMSQALRAYAEWQLTGDDAAVAELDAAAAWFLSGSNSRQRTSLVHGWLAEVTAAGNSVSSARRHAAHTLRRVRDAGDRLGEGMAWRALARLEEQSGRPDRADRYCDLALRSADLRQSRRERAQTRLVQASLELGRGRPSAARAHAREAATAFAAMNIPVYRREAEALIASH